MYRPFKGIFINVPEPQEETNEEPTDKISRGRSRRPASSKTANPYFILDYESSGPDSRAKEKVYRGLFEPRHLTS